jgi:hypothetical protein
VGEKKVGTDLAILYKNLSSYLIGDIFLKGDRQVESDLAILHEGEVITDLAILYEDDVLVFDG